MPVIRILTMVAGAGIVGWTVLSAIKTVVLPRSAQTVLARGVFSLLRVVFEWPARRSEDESRRDGIMALYAPIALVALAGVWLTMVVVGYMLMFWALDPGPWSEAFNLSGSSITTLGFAPAVGSWARLLAFTEAGWGLFLVALVITFLPAMYQAFSRRELRVAMLEVRAGNPPSAVEFLIRHHRIGWLDQLDDYWLQWEEWFSELEETHTTYPALNFFRSPHAGRSWVTAAGTVLDAASLMASSLAVGSQGPLGVCIRSGYIALRRIATFFAISFDREPAPTDPISITRQEYDAALDALAEAGLPVRPDREQAWRDYSGWRVNYDTVLLALAQITMAPYAPWTADRSGPEHLRPRIRRFGRKVLDAPP